MPPPPAAARLLVTGGGGFVGRWLVARLKAEWPGARIIGTVRLPTAAAAEGVETIPLDVVDRERVLAAVRALRPTGLVHLAAVASASEARLSGRRSWDVNLGGTMNLAEAVREEAPGCRFVFAGTSESYGGTFAARAGTPLDEDAPLDPANGYAASKAAADLLVGQMARDGLDAVRLRPFNHTGPGQGEDFAIPSFAAQIARIEAGLRPAVIRVGNLDAVRHFLDVRDVVDGYVRALVAPDLPAGAVFNLASGAPERVGDVLQGLLRLARVPIRVEPDPARMRPSDMPVAAGSAARARAALGWQPRIPLARTLGDVLESWRR